MAAAAAGASYLPQGARAAGSGGGGGLDNDDDDPLAAAQRTAFYVNSGVYKIVVEPGPAGSDPVTPFARVMVSYTMTLAASSSTGSGSSNQASQNTSIDDYGDSSPLRPQSGGRMSRPPLHTFGEGQQVVDKIESWELHVTNSDPLTPLVPGLDAGIGTMHVGEEAVFMIDPSRAYSECGSTPSVRIPKDATLAVRVKVMSVMPEIDLTEGQRQIVKHIVRPGPGSSLTHPQYDAQVHYVLLEQNLLTGTFLPTESVTTLGGSVTPEWLDRVLSSMTADEFCNVLVAGKTTYRVLLKSFVNRPTPTDMEALETAKRLRLEGNDMFTSRHPKTYSKYSAALFYTTPSHYPLRYHELEKQIVDLQAVIHQNSGLVALRGKQFDMAINHFTTAIELTSAAPKFKLFFNRAKAYRQTKQYELAGRDLTVTEQLLQQQPPSSPTTPTGTVDKDYQLYTEELALFQLEQQAAQLSTTS